ncbi:uncharacterized protein LOC117114575, partial [Anneissia japonica]|uniref:uncharacterized protein LOC117114575 n=1 Tax=Anneissia japonica TaxID=1529436 RepID=UPI001425B2F2
MVSYSWNNKNVVYRISQRLENDYKIWIDKTKLVGHIDEAMAKAVKEVDLVLVCLSKKYEESDNCKAEVRCIKEFKKASLPLKMEKYDVDSWVAATFGRELYVDFSDESKFDESFKDLLTRLDLKFASM